MKKNAQFSVSKAMPNVLKTGAKNGCATSHGIWNAWSLQIQYFWHRRRSKYPSIEGVNVEVVSTYKYLGVHLDNKLDWSANTDPIYKKGQSRLYFLRRLRSFNVCSKLLGMFYQSVVASVLFYAVVCWGGSTKKRDAGRLDRLVRKAGSVVGAELESIASVAEKITE